MAFFACKDDDNNSTQATATPTDSYPAIQAKFGGVIDLDNLDNYSAQAIPNYITKDNTTSNSISDKGATLGRVLFYDMELSIDRSISCASCHQQAFAFGDNNLQSDGVNGGKTGRHSMRLVNSRFSDETQFFWDERAATLEEQTTMPIQDHAEMGFSGQDGNPDLDDLLGRLQAIDYYQEFFQLVYGDSQVTEERIQNALAQFIRSIQSFDSKYDAGRSQTPNNNLNFSNFTAKENQGKQLFNTPPNQGGAGCAGCHRPPEFDIDPNSRNNGVIGNLADNANDLSNTRAPSLRDLSKDGILNGPLMHDGSLATLEAVIDHYDRIMVDPANNQLDVRLSGGPRGQGQDLQLTQDEKEALVAFLQTLEGDAIYTDSKWSSPF